MPSVRDVRREEETADHVVFRCRNVSRVKDEKGRRDGREKK